MASDLQCEGYGEPVMGQATTIIVLAAAAVAAIGTSADAQGRRDVSRNRVDVARAQGVPPGQLPPANQCRVWYDSRPNGRQPSPTSCQRAEAIASRDRNARVVYGEDVYWDARDGYYGGSPSYDPNTGAVRRDGRVRDPRVTGGAIDPYPYGGAPRDAYGRNEAYQNGYRDGMTKGRDDGEDGDQYDARRHSWYRSGTRGYDDDFGSRTTYQSRYRQGFEAGYSEGYRVYARR